MARVHNPTLFSAYFGVPPEALADTGLIDPFLDVDVPLFIDPVLLEKSTNNTLRTAAHQRFRQHFEVLVRMLAISKTENDAAWKGARRRLDLREPPENGLGYGGSGRSGSSRPEDIREQGKFDERLRKQKTDSALWAPPQVRCCDDLRLASLGGWKAG